MQWPAPLLRRNPKAHKNDFGHVLVIAGSPRMLGAAALTGLAAMRGGAGLTTIAVPRSLNAALQKKISPVIMTWPLSESRDGTFALSALKELNRYWDRFSVIAAGPGLSLTPATLRLVRDLYRNCPLPMVVDADALNALAGNISRTDRPRVLTPHPGEMSRLTGLSKKQIENNRSASAAAFAFKLNVHLVLKGHDSLVASPDGQVIVNRSGNVGMATAGSGDVLTGVIAALIAQKVPVGEAVRFSVWWHGHAGDLAARKRGKASLIATDIIDSLRTGK